MRNPTRTLTKLAGTLAAALLLAAAPLSATPTGLGAKTAAAEEPKPKKKPKAERDDNHTQAEGEKLAKMLEGCRMDKGAEKLKGMAAIKAVRKGYKNLAKGDPAEPAPPAAEVVEDLERLSANLSKLAQCLKGRL